MPQIRNLESLVEDVAREAHTLNEFLTSNAFYTPSFSQGWNRYPELPEDVEQSRRRLAEAAAAVHDLAVGPVEHVKSLAWRVSRIF